MSNVSDKFKTSCEVVNQHLCRKILNTVLPLEVSATNLCSKITLSVTAFVDDLFKIDRCIIGSLQSTRMTGVNVNEESGQNINCVLNTYLNQMCEEKLGKLNYQALFFPHNFY
jgi:hypothetical protein